ncbi:MAG TPA: hypothetical protein VG734_25375 [Lacunisphaera sp.]|nr:hypothetical protein [Lacunisphaera sp.]
MSRAAQSVFAFSVYLFAVGAGLVAIPNTMLTPLSFAPSAEFWPRVLGVLVLCLAWYYFCAARAGLERFFRWTVQVRIGVFVVFGALVLLKLAPVPLALLGTVDLLAALWTAWAVKAGDK